MAADKSAPLPAAEQRNLISKCQQSFSGGVAARRASQRAEAVHQLLLYSLVGFGIMGLLSAAVGWLVAGRALRPVHAITGAARRASEENLGERLALDGPNDELKELADTYDAMLARLDAAFDSQRRFVANASHELRTPLTVMRTAIDVTLAKPGPDPRPARRHGRRGAAGRGAGRGTDRGPADPGPQRPGRRVLGGNRPWPCWPRTRWTLRRRPSGPGPWAWRPRCRRRPRAVTLVLLDRLVANLVDNAVRHNPPGGWIQVATGMRGELRFPGCEQWRGRRSPRISRLSCSSRSGAWRARRPHPGAGLGLSIVRSVAIAHHGDGDRAQPPRGRPGGLGAAARGARSCRPGAGVGQVVPAPGRDDQPAPRAGL